MQLRYDEDGRWLGQLKDHPALQNTTVVKEWIKQRDARLRYFEEYEHRRSKLIQAAKRRLAVYERQKKEWISYYPGVTYPIPKPSTSAPVNTAEWYSFFRCKLILYPLSYKVGAYICK